jgi:hypothetical protein
MANNHDAGCSSGGRGRDASDGGDEPPVLVLWLRLLMVPLTYQVEAFHLLVPPDSRLPGGWKTSASGQAIPPLPVGADLENVIHHRCDKLSEEDRNNPNFTIDFDLWPALLADERLAALEAF